MANAKEVMLNRAVRESGQLGSFGFSIMGGAKSKIPCVVCNVEVGGPAAESGQIAVGDQLLKLNGEDLTELISKDLVSRIRCAPSPSSFIFLEDEVLREKVYFVLQKQEEKRRKLTSSTSETSIQSSSSDRSPSHVSSHISRKLAHSSNLAPTKELEIETSVNLGQPGVVRVRGGKIVSQCNKDELDRAASRSPNVNLPQSGMSSEQRSIKSSCSSNSLGGGLEEDNLHSSEVTGGGKVFVFKQNTVDSGDKLQVTSESTVDSPSNRRLPPTRNGGVRISLNEDIFINEINLSQSEDQHTNSKVSDEGSSQASILMNKYNSKRSPLNLDPYSKAFSLARQLYMLDGFKKSEVAAKLADTSEFGQMVAHEYLKIFDFEGLELDECLRQFLMSFTLSGETQERERIMVHFSHRFFECNPYSFPSYDAVHGITCALLLLNSDLHTDHGGAKMSFNQFVSNLERIGVRLPKDNIKKMYDSIKKRPLESGRDDTVQSSPILEQAQETRVYHVVIPGTFVEVELQESSPLFKEGYILKKNIMNAPHKKVPRGKRQWKPYYAYLKGFLLYFVPPNGSLQYTDTSNAIVITHCLAMTAADYHKKSSVVRVTTSDWHAFLLQTNDFIDCQHWIMSINKAAALYSAPPLAAPIGSSHGFQRPTFPLAPTKNTMEQQMKSHELRAKSIQKELEEHQAYKKTAAKNKLSAAWFEKLEFLQFEFNRFHIYLGSLHSDAVIEFRGPLPTGLVPSPSISTLATSGVGDEYGDMRRDHSPLPLNVSKPPDSPIKSRHRAETHHR